MGLVYLADLNFMIVHKIYNELDLEKKDHPTYYFLIFSASNAFFESVNILYTLLCSKKHEEFRIRPLLLNTLKKKIYRNLMIYVKNLKNIIFTKYDILREHTKTKSYLIPQELQAN